MKESNLIIEEKKPLVVVLSRSYTPALGVIYGLGKAGFSIELVYIASQKGDSVIASCSKYVKKTIEHIGKDTESIVELLVKEYKSRTEQLVLFPTDDFTTSVIDSNSDKLSSIFKMPHVRGNCEGLIVNLMSKDVQLSLAKKKKLRTPQTLNVYLPKDGEIIIPNEIRYPCFLKPAKSIEGRKREMKRCDTQAELFSALKKMRDTRSERIVLIQDYLNDIDEYLIPGVAFDSEVYIPSLLRRIYVGQFHRGVTIVGEVCNIDMLGEMADYLRAFVRELHFTGLFSFDLVKSGDDFYFSEINLRCPGTIYALPGIGINLPVMAVEAIMGKHLRIPLNDIRFGERFLYERVAWDEYFNGYRSERDLKSYYKIANFNLIENSFDPKPGMEFKKAMLNKKRALLRTRRKEWIKAKFSILLPFYRVLRNLMSGKNE